MPALQAVHATDPRKELLKKVGDISDYRWFHNSIVAAIYHRPNKTTLGGKEFFLPDNLSGKTGEDRYQGKVGLVIAKGPLAFVDDERVSFHGQNVEIGDWVVFRASDGFQITLVRGPRPDDAVLCRVFTEADIRAIVPSPDAVW